MDEGKERSIGIFKVDEAEKYFFYEILRIFAETHNVSSYIESKAICKVDGPVERNEEISSQDTSSHKHLYTLIFIRAFIAKNEKL